jgi:hypothetical protein
VCLLLRHTICSVSSFYTTIYGIYLNTHTLYVVYIPYRGYNYLYHLPIVPMGISVTFSTSGDLVRRDTFPELSPELRKKRKGDGTKASKYNIQLTSQKRNQIHIKMTFYKID